MISFIEGKIEHLGEKYAILNAGGIGYQVTMVPKLVSILSKINGNVKLFLHSRMNMREGTFDLYGFQSKGDLELFHTLLGVSGIGPKSAMHIMETVEPRHLKAAVVHEDADYLKKVSGLGPKVASRLILELKNKVDHIDLGDLNVADLDRDSQALEAIVSLGYSPIVAKDALKLSKATKLEEKVREALKILGKK